MRKVGIAGLGGIGSNIAVHLVRSGFGNLKIADYDSVDRSNLNRQFYFCHQIGMNKTDALEENLKKISPEIMVEKIFQRLTPENIYPLFSDCDIIAEGFDQAGSKSMLIEAFAGKGHFVVSASGVAGLDLKNIRTKKYFRNVTVAGDFTTDIKNAKLYSPKVFIVASIMANIILKELGYSDRLE